MSVRRVVRWVLAASAILAVGAILAATFLTNGDPVQATVGSEPVTVIPSISPQSHSFGDRIVAVLDVSVNRGLVDPDLVGADARFPPYRLLGGPDVTRRSVDGITTIRYLYPLQCIDRDCVALMQEPFNFPEARVNFLSRDENRRRSVLVSWPSVSVASRLTSQDLNRQEFRTSTSELLAVTYRVSPPVLGWLLIAIAAVLVLGVGATLFIWLRPVSPRVRPSPKTAVPELSTLEKALELVEAAVNGGIEERRIALDQLARALEGENLSSIALEARRLAWSETSPNDHVIDELIATVRRASEVAA